ncbi:MAG: malto-oligosyltrehalose synthase [Cupriavidus sp.]|nr:malto-oligosyltrehalose synthase [Cupriavidus sp.]
MAPTPVPIELAASQRASGAPIPPRATARLQLHPGFTLEDAARLVDYYARLGVSHLYLSPVFGARPGSMHGYDVTDYSRIRAELGGEPALVALAQRARSAGLGLILDIVPNHMAADSTHNAWWRDVLAHGADSAFAQYFDIDWQPRDPALQGKVLVPILADPYWQAIEQGHLKVQPASTAGPASLRYFEHDLPLAPHCLEATANAAADPGWFDARHIEGRKRLHALLERQHYRLAWWRTAAASLNWRRFFEISDLVGLRQEYPPVFAATHALVFRLLREGYIDGVRVDHVDGLADPAEYCRQMRAHLTLHAARRSAAQPLPRPWLIVEKILGPHERLPVDWQVDGTTGYDFMNEISAVLHCADGEASLTALWQRTCGRRDGYEQYASAARRLILTRHLITEYEGLCVCLHRYAAQNPATRDLTLSALRRAVAALLTPIAVYRSYIDDCPQLRDSSAVEIENGILQDAVSTARAELAPDEIAALDFILDCLRDHSSPGSIPCLIRRRLQQLMPALAAKAGEDTAFYRFGRLLSRNEVGSDPATLAISEPQFHACMTERSQHFPRAMLATATHDHKRGEDARMRLAVLSEVAGDWSDAVASWENNCASLLASLPRRPEPADRLMLYQTILGAWPMEADALKAKDARAAFLRRIGDWQRKAIREAKLHGNWTCPDLTYEDACEAFLQRLEAGWPDSGVLAAIGKFVRRVAAAGAINSLAQVTVLLTAPGVPDRYQGCESWDFSLVDPDNRRVPDHARLQAQLGCTAPWAHWMSHWQDGRIKQQLIRSVLAVRRQQADLFDNGRYRPLLAQGPLAPQVLAFTRSAGGQEAAVIVTRLAARYVNPVHPCIPPSCWLDTTLDASAPNPSVWIDALTGTILNAPLGKLAMREVLVSLPVALLLRQP